MRPRESPPRHDLFALARAASEGADPTAYWVLCDALAECGLQPTAVACTDCRSLLALREMAYVFRTESRAALVLCQAGDQVCVRCRRLESSLPRHEARR